jgi:hypothetical protein
MYKSGDQVLFDSTQAVPRSGSPVLNINPTWLTGECVYVDGDSMEIAVIIQSETGERRPERYFVPVSAVKSTKS